MVIRKAERADFQSVKYLEELDFRFHRQMRTDYFTNSEDSYTKVEFENLLAHSHPIALVAVLDGSIAGICFGVVEDTAGNHVCKSRKVAFIQDLVTMPEYRGRGIATALLAEARKEAVHAGAVSMELCVWEFNEKARRLYEKLGMKVQYCRMEADLENG